MYLEATQLPKGDGHAFLPKNRGYLVLFPFVVVSFLLVGLSYSISHSIICFAVMRYVLSKTFVKKIWGGTKLQRRCSGFQVTAIMEGFFGFEIFDSAILLG